jgi:prepilin-type N-terminal cleavage/methylation domain-containing protein
MSAHSTTQLGNSQHCVTGFTLVETLLVVALLSIASLVVLPSLNPIEPFKVEHAAAEVAAAFRYARTESMRTAIPYGVHAQTMSQRFRVVSAVGGALPPSPAYDVYRPISKQLYDVNVETLTSTPGISVTQNATWTSVCDEPDFLYFDAHGRPHCANPWGALLIDSTVTLSWSGQARTVTIAGETGRVTVQ